MPFTLVTVTATYKQADNVTPAVGSVTFQPTALMANEDMVAPTSVKAVLDSTGSISVQLPATDDVGTTPTGVTWKTTERIQGADDRIWYLPLPHAQTAVNLRTVAPALPATPAYPYLLKNGDTATGAMHFPAGYDGVQLGAGLSVVKYCSPAGNDSNDGSSWSAAKATFLAAYDALPAGGGTIYVADNTSIGGTVANQGLWIVGPNDRNYLTPPAGWRVAKNLRVIGVGQGNGGFAKTPQALIGWGSGTDRGKPALWISGDNSPLTFENLAIQYPAVGIRLGIDSSSPAPYTTLRDTNTAGIVFENVSVSLNQILGNGPGVDVGYCFWAYCHLCAFGANQQQALTDDKRACVLIKPTAASSGLFFVDNCVGSGGQIKYYVGASSWSLYVKDFTTENATPYAVQFADTFGLPASGNAVLETITMADNVAGIATVLVPPGTPSECVVCINTSDVTGPATVVSRYAAAWVSTTRTPAGQGQVGFWNGRVSAQQDSDRRAFGPSAVRFANLVPQAPSSWTALGSAVLTPGIPAPDGTTGAGQGSTAAATFQEIQIASLSRAVTVNDWFVFGLWVRGPSGLVDINTFIDNLVQLSFTGAGNQLASPGATYLVLRSPIKGEGEWEWVSAAVQVSAVGSSPAGVILRFRCSQSNPIQVYAPILIQIPASANYSQSEIYELTQHLHSWPDGAPVGSVAWMAGAPLYAPNSGSNVIGGLAIGPNDGGRSLRVASGSGDLVLYPGSGGYRVIVYGGISSFGGGGVSAEGGLAAWNHAIPSSQPAAPITLADVIAIIRGCGLSA